MFMILIYLFLRNLETKTQSLKTTSLLGSRDNCSVGLLWSVSGEHNISLILMC